jgi:hypothetical protein
MSLTFLPLEILQHIAVYVEIAHRPSLNAFSLTSKTCHKASLFLVFRQISIAVHDGEGLRRDVDRLIGALSRTDSSRHVRQITIKGALTLNANKTKEGYARGTPWLVTSGLDEVLDEEPVDYGCLYAVYDEPVIKASSEEDMAWAPVVNFLQTKTTHLKDLVYDCQSQFPPSLLRVLHEQHPTCRLHHLTFRFRTLLWGVPFPYEMELATSPCLYRVKLATAPRDTDGDDDFNLEALMELTTGLAPNLKEVEISSLLPGRSLRYIRPRAAWQGLSGFTVAKMGSLTSLLINGYSRLSTPNMLQGWARHTDFACLQHLSLGGSYDAKTWALSGETMEWIARNHSFPRVKTLAVYLNRDDLLLEQPRYSEHAVAFFQAFESLEELSINGAIDAQILDIVLSHHGQTVRKLSLHPFEDPFANSNGRHRTDIVFEFTKARLLQITAQCPVLESLAIVVKRNASRASEAQLYTCFGAMKSLKSLFLVLDCSNWHVTRDSTYAPHLSDAKDQNPVGGDSFSFVSRGELKTTFINCAIDAALALSIWTTITQHKAGTRLQRLKLWPTGAGEYGYGGNSMPLTFLAMALSLARSWMVELDGGEDLKVRELGRMARKVREEEEKDYLAYRHNAEIWEVLWSVWEEREGGDWRDEWSSFPLEKVILEEDSLK